MPDAVFFATPDELHRWLEANHATAAELWVGFYKKESGIPGITYQQALDEALAFGWIDGVRKTVDAARWMIRFSPRKPGSIWSRVNLKRVGELIQQGRMQTAGLAVYEQRRADKSEQYSYERESAVLDAAYQSQFEANAAAWATFQAQPPYYRRAAVWWVMSAKKDETRLRRLAQLIDFSAKGERIPSLNRNQQ